MNLKNYIIIEVLLKIVEKHTSSRITEPVQINNFVEFLDKSRIVWAVLTKHSSEIKGGSAIIKSNKCINSFGIFNGYL